MPSGTCFCFLWCSHETRGIVSVLLEQKLARNGLGKCMKAVIFSIWYIITYTSVWLFRVSSSVFQSIDDRCYQKLTVRPLFDLQRGDHQKNNELFRSYLAVWQFKIKYSKCKRQHTQTRGGFHLIPEFSKELNMTARVFDEGLNPLKMKHNLTENR